MTGAGEVACGAGEVAWGGTGEGVWGGVREEEAGSLGENDDVPCLLGECVDVMDEVSEGARSMNQGVFFCISWLAGRRGLVPLRRMIG